MSLLLLLSGPEAINEALREEIKALTGLAIYLPMTKDFVDASGNGRAQTPGGGLAAGGSATTPIVGEKTSTDFPGGEWLDSNYEAFVNGTKFSIGAWVWRDTTERDGLWGAQGGAPLWEVGAEWDAGNGTDSISYVAHNFGTPVSWQHTWPGTGQWVLIGFNVNDATGKIEPFVNGVSLGEKTTQTEFSSHLLQIGEWGGHSGAESLDGKMVHFFATSGSMLTAEQWKSLYTTGTGILTLSLEDSASLADALSKGAIVRPNDTAALSETMKLSAAKTVADNVAISETVNKAVGKPVSDSTTLSETVSKAVGKPVADNASLSDTVSKVVGKGIADAAALSETVSKAVSKAASDVIALADELAETHLFKLIELLLEDSVSLTDAIAKSVGLNKADSAALSETVSKEPRLTAADSAPLTDAVAKSAGIHASDAVSLADSAGKAIGRFIGDTVPLADFAKASIKALMIRTASFGDEGIAEIDSPVGQADITTVSTDAEIDDISDLVD